MVKSQIFTYYEIRCCKNIFSPVRKHHFKNWLNYRVYQKYVYSQIDLSFTGLNQSVYYLSKEGKRPSTSLKIGGVNFGSGTKVDGISIVDRSKSVQLRDLRSGAVFVFRKYWYVLRSSDGFYSPCADRQKISHERKSLQVENSLKLNFGYY